METRIQVKDVTELEAVHDTMVLVETLQCQNSTGYKDQKGQHVLILTSLNVHFVTLHVGLTRQL